MNTETISIIITVIIMGAAILGFIIYVIKDYFDIDYLKLLIIIGIGLIAIDTLFILAAVSKWAFNYLF